jgi:hypothetical protein
MLHYIERLVEKLILPVALLVGVLGLVYWYWTTTPSYAVNSVVDSLRHHDVQQFEKYVDVDSLTSHAFDDLLEGPGRDELLGRIHNNSFIGMGFLRFFKHDIVGMAHEKVTQFIGDPSIELEAAADGNTNTLGKYRITPHIRQELIDFGLTRYGFQGIKYLDRKEHNTALLGLEFYSPKMQQSYVVEFQLEDVGGYWRVTELRNLNDLIDLYLRSHPDKGHRELESFLFNAMTM